MAVSVVGDEALLPPLGRLLVSGGPLRIFGSGTSGALLGSSSATNRRLLEALLERGYVSTDNPTSPTECSITAAGRDWLLEMQNPRLLLEDFVRAAEAQRECLQSMQETIGRLGQRLEQQSADVRSVLAALRPGAQVFASQVDDSAIDRALRDLRHRGVAADCSMAELYDFLVRQSPDVSIGQFHDAIRRLHFQGVLVLSPWTGALYELPRPELAMLIGHEVLYYVRLCRNTAVA